MDIYQNILVVIDPTRSEQKGLNRAIELSSLLNSTHNTEVKITAFLSIYDFSYEMSTLLSSDERDAMRAMLIKEWQLWLNELMLQLNTSIVITSVVIWHNRPFEAIIRHVIDYNFDLVIKSTHQHDKLKSVVFTPTDWHILRKCPCSVLLVKEHLWPKNGNILAAVNLGTDEAEHQSLNQKITRQATQLAQIIKAKVHLVNSYPGTPVNIAIEIPEFNTSGYNDAMRKHHQQVMQEHSIKFSFDPTNTHVKEGLPEIVIEDLAQELDAELVILGTIGRTGFSAVLIGNTAEHVIDQLNCDLLALKPEGYLSPLAH